MEPPNRKLLLQPDVTPDFRHPTPSPPPAAPVPSSTSSSSYDYLPSEFLNIPGNPTDDSSTTATVVAILAVLLLFALFSIYMRRLGNQGRSLQRRSRPTQPSPSPSPAPPQSVELYVLKSLPVLSFRENAKYQSDCAICLGEYEEDELVKLIPFCQHVYHPHCIDTWLSSHVSCPICRSTRFFKYDGKGDPGGE